MCEFCVFCNTRKPEVLGVCLLKWKWATLLWMVIGILDFDFYIYILFFCSGVFTSIMSSDKLFSASDAKIAHNRAAQWFPNVLLSTFKISRWLLWRFLKIHLALIALVSSSFCLTNHCFYLKKELFKFFFLIFFLLPSFLLLGMRLICNFLENWHCVILRCWAWRPGSSEDKEKSLSLVDIPLSSDIL